MNEVIVIEKEITDLAASAEKSCVTVLEVAKSYTIDNAIMAELAAEELVAIKTKQKEMDEQRKGFTRPLDDRKKEIMNLFEPAVTLLKDAETLLKNAITEWNKKEQVRLALEAKAQREEQARLQREAAKAEQEARAKAAEAMLSGDVAKAEELSAQADNKAAQAEVLQYTAPVATAPTKLAGVSGREEWDFEITNPDAIPRQYLFVDDTKIRKVVKALGSQTNIPGVRVFQKTVMSVRTKR